MKVYLSAGYYKNVKDHGHTQLKGLLNAHYNAGSSMYEFWNEIKNGLQYYWFVFIFEMKTKYFPRVTTTTSL